MCAGDVCQQLATQKDTRKAHKNGAVPREARQVLNASGTAAAGLKRKETLWKEASCLVVTGD